MSPAYYANYEKTINTQLLLKQNGNTPESSFQTRAEKYDPNIFRFSMQIRLSSLLGGGVGGDGGYVFYKKLQRVCQAQSQG